MRGPRWITDLSEMANCYVEAIRTVQPNGPYRLGGWSFGGYVAFEMARRLRERGREVALLAVFDTVVDTLDVLAHQEPDEAEMLVKRFDMLPLTAGELRALDPGERLRYVIRLGQASGIIPAEFDLATAQRHLDVYKANAEALRHYRPGPYAGRVTLFRATRRKRTVSHALLGWEPLAAGGVEVLDVAGWHFNMMSRPAVEIVGRHLRACLDRVAGAAAAQEAGAVDPQPSVV